MRPFRLRKPPDPYDPEVIVTLSKEDYKWLIEYSNLVDVSISEVTKLMVEHLINEIRASEEEE